MPRATRSFPQKRRIYLKATSRFAAVNPKLVSARAELHLPDKSTFPLPLRSTRKETSPGIADRRAMNYGKVEKRYVFIRTRG